MHPGYGFLSENADFAQAVLDAGLIWVGPPPAAIRALGNKASAKELSFARKVPCLPGYQGPDQSDARLVAEAERIGYPVMVKATTGGGGRGMRLVLEPSQLQAALASARSEALSSFGSDELLLERGIKYDHSLMHDDFHPYRVRVGDRWTKIDYSGRPADWMKPLQRGKETPLIEIPANWYLDDLPPMMFIKKAPNSHGFVNPRDIEQMWRDQFDWVYREHDYAVFPMTIHPDVAGRPHVLLMLERLYHHMASQPGVRFVTLEEMARDFRRRHTAGG